jgi:hypothetical protein
MWAVQVGYKIYLDDVRTPNPDCAWVVCRTVNEAIQTIELHGLPDQISFDHDLGEGQADGIELAKWLIESHLDEKIDLYVSVHGAFNESGRSRKHRLLVVFISAVCGRNKTNSEGSAECQ